MAAASHWKVAFPYYLKVSFRQSIFGWAGPLFATLAGTAWTGVTENRLAFNRIGLEFSIALGGFFFVLTLLTAVGEDVHRNWGAQEQTVAWNPLLMWKTFLYIGAISFLVAAFLAYHEGCG